MGTPTVSSISPISNATDVDTRATISITFSEGIDTSTAVEGTIVLTDLETLESVPVSFSYITNDTIVKLLPERELRSNKRYKVTIAGSASDLPAGWIKSKTANALASTYTSIFRTETERFVSLEEVTDRDDIDHVAPIREESELAEASGYISVSGTTPKGFSTNNKNLDEIVVTFSESINANAFSASMFALELNPVLDLDRYLGNTDSGGVKKLYLQDDDVPIVLPSGNAVIASDTITWTRAQPTLTATDHPRHNTFPYNAEVIVTLSSLIKGNVSSYYLGTDVKFAFTTELFPMFSGARTLRLDVGPSIDDFYDDTLNRMILKRSIDAWEIGAREFSLINPKNDALVYVRYGSLLDILEVISIKADIQRGTRKKLGDFQVDYASRAFSKDTGRFQTAREALEAATFRLQLANKGVRTRTSNLGANSSAGQVVFRGTRNWDTLITRSLGGDLIPQANSPSQREIARIIDQGGRATVYYSPDATDNGYIYVYNTGGTG